MQKKPKNQHKLSKSNNFFLQNTQLKHKQKSIEKQLNSFHQFKEQIPENDYLYQNQKELLHTDRNHNNNNKKQFHYAHKRTNSTIKKQQKNNHDLIINSTSRQPPTPSTNVSTKFKDKSSVTKNLNHNNTKVNKNISDLIKMPKKKILSIINNSSLGDQQSLKSSIPGWPGKKVIQRFGPLLNQQQKKQLENQKEVFYIGVGTGNGQDDHQGSYQWKRHQQVGFRYQLLEPLGSGAFGQVIRAFDHKKKQHVAVKIIRSKKQHMQLALNQINILMKAKQKDVQNQKNILRIKDFIVFRKHICIITQLLSISLYQLLQSMNFQQIELNYIRTFAIQILNALAYLKEIKVIHSDLKPENVMLKNKNKTGIKLIDFGTSMYSNQTNFLYIQSRFYRAPQVILGGKYSYQIDMWSFGCLLAQLYLGQPIFAGANQQQQLTLIMQSIGATQNIQFLKKCKNYLNYFNSDFTPKTMKNKQGKIVKPLSKQLILLIQDKAFCQYLSKILVFDPKKRYTPLQALLDPWILQGLPEQIKQQHLMFIKQKMKEQKKTTQKQKQKTKDKQKQKKQQKQKNKDKDNNKPSVKKMHKRSNTSDYQKDCKFNNNITNKKHQQSFKKQQYENDVLYGKTTRKHSRRNSDFKFQQFNAKQNHLSHRRRGSAGIF